MIATMAYRLDDSGAVRALLLAVAAVCMLAAGLAMFAGLSLLCTVCAPTVAGCCAATVGVLPELCVMAGLLVGLWMIRPK